MANSPDGQIKDTWHIRKGSTFNRIYEWKTGTVEDSDPVNLTDYTIRSMVKEGYEGALIFSLTIGTGITVSDPTTGKFEITLTAEQTNSVTANKGVFDIELVSPGGVVKNLIGGSVSFYKQVTT